MSVPEREGISGKRVLERGALRIELDGGSEGAGPALGTSVVRLRGDLDMEGAPVLERELIALTSGPVSTIFVDLTGLEFVDSTGLQCLLRATEHARQNGHTLQFRRGSGQVEGVMRLTRVAESLPFAD
jgi:anti-sigma B factor antagonist